jgi:hypothetical protein
LILDLCATFNFSFFLVARFLFFTEEFETRIKKKKKKIEWFVVYQSRMPDSGKMDGGRVTYSLVINGNRCPCKLIARGGKPLIKKTNAYCTQHNSDDTHRSGGLCFVCYLSRILLCPYRGQGKFYLQQLLHIRIRWKKILNECSKLIFTMIRTGRYVQNFPLFIP